MSHTDATAKRPGTRARALRFLRELAVLAAMALLAMGVGGWLRAPDLPPRAPTFTLGDLDGQPVSLGDYAGRPVILNFWATWCGPCRLEAPILSAFAERNPDIPVLGIAADGSVEALRRTAEELGVDYRILRGDRATLAAYRVDTYPTTVVVDAQGRVVSSHTGLMLRPHLWFATLGIR